MSKFKIEKYLGKLQTPCLLVTYDHGVDPQTMRIVARDLSDLASCVSSALAEQNSRVMGARQCGCDGGMGKRELVCAEYGEDCGCCTPPVCDKCGWCRACHSTQSTDQAPSTRMEG